MYLILPQEVNELTLLDGEIYGSWNNWKTPIKIQDYNFTIEDYYVFFIDTNNSFSYKIKLNGKNILIENYLTVKNGIYTNNHLIANENTSDNGLFQTTENNNNLLIYKLNKLMYDCDMKNNCPHGLYKKYYSNGSIYFEGQFRNNKCHGHGTIYFPNGNKEYEGEFANDYCHGIGIEYYPNGNKKYEGPFQNEKLYSDYIDNNDIDNNDINDIDQLVENNKIEWVRVSNQLHRIKREEQLLEIRQAKILSILTKLRCRNKKPVVDKKCKTINL